jgi:hypothetical protein
MQLSSWLFSLDSESRSANLPATDLLENHKFKRFMMLSLLKEFESCEILKIMNSVWTSELCKLKTSPERVALIKRSSKEGLGN